MQLRHGPMQASASTAAWETAYGFAVDFENTLRPAGGQSRPPLQERVCADLRLQAPGFLQGGQKFVDILFGLCVRYVVFCGEGGEERGAVGALFQRAP